MIKLHVQILSVIYCVSSFFTVYWNDHVNIVTDISRLTMAEFVLTRNETGKTI